MNISLAITIPDEVKHNLADAIERFKPRARGTLWEERDQLQLPIAKIGAVAPAFVPHLTRAVTTICENQGAFSVCVHGFGFYGTKRFPHNVWAAVAPSEAMNNLHEEIWGTITRFGFKRPTGSYRPHIILGRCRGGVKNRALIDAIDADTEMEMGSWEARKLTIYDCASNKRSKVHRKVKELIFGERASI